MITTRDKILSAVMKPTRYTGGELNSVIKNPADVDVRFGFCFADTYEIAMSHLGLKILYHTLNDREDTYCERVCTLDGYGRRNEKAWNEVVCT